MIHRLRVQNFKSILDVNVKLSPVTVLVGKSGTGKSNFVNALRFLRDLLTSENKLEEWALVKPASHPKASLSFEIEFSIAGIEEPYTYTLAFSPHGPKFTLSEERLLVGTQCLFHQRVSDGQTPGTAQWVEEPNLVQLPHSGPIALGRLPSMTDAVIAFTALTSGIGCYAFSDNVLCSVGQPARTAGLDDGATNYLHVLKGIATNLQDLTVRRGIVEALKQVNPSVSSVELNDLQKPDHVVVGHRLNGKTLALQLSQESDGFRRFYAHLLALYQRPPKQTLIFEHPEDGIHPGALSLLADEFQAAPVNDRGQVILTTHSPRLLDHFDADQIRVVELHNYETKIGPVSQEQREAIHDKLLDAGELLTVDDARLDEHPSEATGA